MSANAFLARVKTIIGWAAGGALVTGWFWLASHVSGVDQNSPRVPDPNTGEIVPVHWKSVIVYERASDAQLHNWLGAFFIVVVALFLGRVLLQKYWGTWRNS